MDILERRKTDPTFYPVIYGADREDDWTDEKVWHKANPSLGITVPIEKVRKAYNSAKQNPAEENSFRQLRLNQSISRREAEEKLLIENYQFRVAINTLLEKEMIDVKGKGRSTKYALKTGSSEFSYSIKRLLKSIEDGLAWKNLSRFIPTYETF